MKILKCIEAVFSFMIATQAYSIQCLKVIDLMAEHSDLPPNILLKIARVESGLGPQKTPWPWAIQVQGKSYYFKTEKGASFYIKKLLSLGIENFDVGCFQINYYWHKNKVRSPFDLLKPLKNTLIAAQFLSHLKDQHKSWHKAVSYYHSSDLEKGVAYAKLVFHP